MMLLNADLLLMWPALLLKLVNPAVLVLNANEHGLFGTWPAAEPAFGLLLHTVGLTETV
jgi:hypothetical protein